MADHGRLAQVPRPSPRGVLPSSAGGTSLIAEGIGRLQTALAREELGEFQVQAAIAALHADAQRVEDTDWPQIVEWYDELLKLSDSPVVALNRAVAIGEADGPVAGLAELSRLDDGLPRYFAVEAHLRERAGEFATTSSDRRPA